MLILYCLMQFFLVEDNNIVMSENSNHSDSELHLFNQESFGEILKDLEPDTRCLINAGVDTLTNRCVSFC